MSGSESERPKPTIHADDDEQEVQLWFRLPPPVAVPAGLARIADIVHSTLQSRLSGTYRIVEDVASPASGSRSFELRSRLGGGIRISLWLDGPMLRVRSTTSSRIETLWGLGVIACGLLVWVFVSCGFAAGMMPHFTITRHATKLGSLVGIASALLVAIVTWIPLRLLTRSARAKSYADARRVVEELAQALAEAGPPPD